MATWGLPGDDRTIKTPFNIQAIISACPKLREKWEEHPFYFDVDEQGKVVIVYVELTL